MIDVLLGLQWGDEGKGKMADFLTTKYELVARFQGGPNAGHSLEFNGKKHVLNTIPSGIFHENCTNLIGNGVVIDPVRLRDEINRTIEAGADVKKGLIISENAHLILPTHRVLDAASEHAKGDAKIGSTLRGIGPTYRDKIGRSGLRVGDINTANFDIKYKAAVERHIALIEHFGFTDYNLPELEEEFFSAVDFLKQFKKVKSEYYINEALSNGTKILAEGAQGTLLDVDFGSYPFVTSSNTIAGGATVGLGISPRAIDGVKGIFKAYCTRVGNGPFPTELGDEDGQRLRDIGREYGATTGRPRATGWLDMVALKYAVMLNGITELYMMKADVLSGFKKVKVCTAYKINGEITHEMPFEMNDAVIEPVYEEFDGWDEDLMICRSWDSLPKTFQDFVIAVEKMAGAPINIVSVGPDREQTIIR